MPRRRALRLSLLGVAALLVIAVVVTVGLGVFFVRRPFPGQEGTVDLEGLAGPVTVLRDERGVPQLYADTAEDLFRAQGYVQAQDRFFEMDWRRHVTAGRLAELTGNNPGAIAADKVIRTLGWRRVAEQELALADARTRRYLEAFARGVNDYVAGRTASRLSLNYTVLGVNHDLKPVEPWTPVDSIAWFKAMAWDLRGNYTEELDRARLFATVKDVDRIRQLYPAYPFARHAPILPSRTPSAAAAGAADPQPAGTTAVASARLGAGAASARLGAGAASRPAPPASAPARPAAPASAPARPAALASAPAPATALAGSPQVLAALRSDAVQDALDLAGQALHAMPIRMGGGDGLGSNSWVVSGRFTATGKPLLANDPHLTPSIPGVWYQMGLHCRRQSDACPYDVAGYTFAGVPGVVIGHTNRIAWGITNLGPDVTDFYLERLQGDTYLVDGNYRPLQTRREQIAVAGADPVEITVRSTGHGPLLSDVLETLRTAGRRSPVPKGAPQRGGGYGVSLAWTALTPGRNMDAIFTVNAAADFESFRRGVLLMDVPAQNFVYADIDGHIGYQAPGRIPIRRGAAATPAAGGGTAGGTGGTAGGGGSPGAGAGQPGPGAAAGGAAAAPGADQAPGADRATPPTDGTWPLPGWDSRNDWQGFVPASQMPFALDPAEGFVVAANQAVTPPGDPVRITSDWDYGYRSQRIRELLGADIGAGRRLQVADMQRMQVDTRNGIAADLVPVLLREKVDAFTGEAVALLRDWQFDQPEDSAAAAYFNAVWASLLDLTFADEMPVGTKPTGGGRWNEVVRSLLRDPQDQWWDDRRTPNVVETRDEIISRALVDARLRLTRILGKDPGEWKWGSMHRLTLVQRPLGGLRATTPLRPLLNRGPMEAPGGTSIVNAMAWDASTGSFDVTAAPSMRMIVDLSAFDRSQWVNQTGQSGHPGHPNYTDQLDAWDAGESFPWPFSEPAVTAAAVQTLTLRPRG